MTPTTEHSTADPAARASDHAQNAQPADAAASELAFLRRVLAAEAHAIELAAERLDEGAARALDILADAAERGSSVIVCGMGKSGLVGRKISATLASLGVPSHELHPAEAMHGDLGRIRRGDCLLALSFSGETEELVALSAILKQDGVPIVAITRDHASALARSADAVIALGSLAEAPAHDGEAGLAPTCSTTATLAIGDALALALARRAAFTDDDFARRHPGGTLGGLMRPVLDVLRFRVGDNLPVAVRTMTVRAALAHAESVGRRPGALIAVEREGGPIAGIFTDSDLRRLLLKDEALLDEPLDAVMTHKPRTLADTALVRDAVRLVREHRQDEIPIVDANGRPVGLLDVQDLIALRVVRS
jgi:arabinose-5-phosphate isomerase